MEEIVIPSEIKALSPNSLETLHLFIIPLRTSKLKVIDTEKRFYKFKRTNQHYYDWVKYLETKGYNYIISELCWTLPFFDLKLCCHICKEAFGCKQREENIYLWLWKSVVEKDFY